MKSAIKNFFIACSVIICLSVSIYGQGTTQYVYDDNGRLKAVVLPNGETSVYTYDAAGNIILITRQNTPVVSISSFTSTPISCMSTGNSEITVNGIGFISGAGQNTISFNAAPGTVISATPTQIVASMPPGFVSGTVKITNANGTAEKFFGGSESEDGTLPVIPNSNVPQTVNFSTSGQVISLCFEGNANKFSSYVLNNLNFAEMDVSLVAPSGSNVISSTYQAINGQIFVDSTLLEETGLYLLKITPGAGQIGSADVSVFEFDHISAGLLTDGTPTDVSIASPGQNVRLNSTMIAGTYKLSLEGSAFTRYSVGIYRSSDNQFINFANLLPTTLIDIPEDFYIVFDPADTATGNARFKLEPLTLNSNGTPETVRLYSPNQIGKLTFSALAGQRYTLQVSNVTAKPASLQVLKPDGEVLTSAFIDFFFTGTFLQFATPADGVYTIVFDPFNSVTGSATFSLNLLNEVSGTLNINDPPTTFTSTVPGQAFRITMAGTRGQRLFLKMASDEFFSVNLVIQTPNGVELLSIPDFDPGKVVDVINLGDTGNYTLLITPNFAGQAGNLTLRAIDNNAFLSNTSFERIHAYFRANVIVSLQTKDTSINRDKNPKKAKQTVNLPVPANLTDGTAVYYYNGTENESFSFAANAQVPQQLSFTGGTISIYKQDGTQLDSFPFDSGICNLILPETGTYRIEVAPDVTNGDFIFTRSCGGPSSFAIPKSNPAGREIAWTREKDYWSVLR